MSQGNGREGQTNDNSTSTLADSALVAAAVGAVIAIGYFIYRQRADREELFRLMSERERKREEQFAILSQKTRGDAQSVDSRVTFQKTTTGFQKNRNTSSMTTEEATERAH